MLGLSCSLAAGNGDSLRRIKNSTVIRRTNAFLRSPWYVVLLAALTAVSNAYALDLYLYSSFIAIGIYLSICGEDYLPLMPIVIFCYIAPSRENNPGRYPNSIFYPENGGIYLIVLAAVFAISILIRLIGDGELGGKRFLREKRSLIPGMLLLGGGYLLSGLGVENYSQIAGSNLLFALIQFASVFVMYFFFTGAVRWERTPKDYFAWIGLCVGYVVFSQLLGNYLSGAIFVDGYIDRELIATGWGMHNNIGGMMAMSIPFAFYLAYQKKQGWIFNILGTGLLIGVMMSCSRASMFTAVGAYGISAILLMRAPFGRLAHLVVFLVTMVALVLAVEVLQERLLEIFQVFLDNLFIISSRDKLYVHGLKLFRQFPVFGGSFYPQSGYIPWDWADLEQFSSFFPPRWHNTLVQIGASCGTVGLVGYLIHRVQTLKLFFTKVSVEKLFIAVFVAALLFASLLDCHFFNVGPVLLYSMALAFAEKCGAQERCQ